MGIGDNLMAAGIARGSAARGKRIAFGDGRRIRWDQHSEPIFRGNPNIAPPGAERTPGIEWVPFFKGRRIYNRHDAVKRRWIWNYGFKAKAGEVFLTEAEQAAGERAGRGFAVIEPNLPPHKSCAVNKDWGRERYQEVARRLRAEGHRVVQFGHG